METPTPGGAPAASEGLPLRYRLPNAPALFVGREAETGQLAEAIGRAPVAVVWGLGGLGKTALVSRTLTRHFAREAERTVFLRLAAHDSGDQLRLELVRALVSACRVERVDWERLLADHELLVGVAIDLAEGAGLWVVLDDVQLAAGPSRALLADLARYARHSRWVVTSREDPRLPELAGQVLALGGLPEAELARLAALCAPGLGPERLAAMVAAAGGSPWQLRQLALGEPGQDNDAVAGLAAAEAALCHRLAHVEVAVPAAVLARLGPTTSRAALDELERRGFLERVSDGWRLHDVARAQLKARQSPEDTRRSLGESARALLESGDAALALEALRLTCLAGRWDEAARELERWAPELVSEGYAPRLWQLLADARAPELGRWRLRIGVAIGAPAVLQTLAALAAPTREDDLSWCRALLAGGRHLECARRAASLRDAAGSAGDAATAFAAGVIEARARTFLGEHREALALLETLPVASPFEAARRDVQAAENLAMLGDFDTGQALVGALVGALGELEGAARTEIGNELLAVLLVLGDLERAVTVLASLAPNVSGSPPALLASRSTLLFRALLGVSLGQLGESRERFQQLGPLFERRSLEGLVLQHGDLLRRLIAGDLERFGEVLAAATADAEAAKSPFFARWCAIWSGYWTLIEAPAEPVAHLAAREPPGGHPGIAAAIRFPCELRAARRGATTQDSEWLAALPPIWAAVLGSSLRAFWLVWEGDAPQALGEIDRGIAASRAHGYRTFELEQLAFACEILALQGRWRELHERAAELAELADQTGSDRFALEAAFHGLVAASPLPVPRVLEPWLARRATAPACARRAALLLGEDVPRDRIDDAIVRAVRERGDWTITVIAGAQAEGPGWGLDATRREVWLPDGRALELGQRPLMWQALEAIAEAGGAITLEVLARRIWGVTAYHPLRDNGRIHTLVNRVRQLLESDAKKPRRLLTTAEGYRFGDAERARWLRSR